VVREGIYMFWAQRDGWAEGGSFLWPSLECQDDCGRTFGSEICPMLTTLKDDAVQRLKTGFKNSGVAEML